MEGTKQEDAQKHLFQLRHPLTSTYHITITHSINLSFSRHTIYQHLNLIFHLNTSIMSSPPLPPRTFRYHSNHEPLFPNVERLVEFSRAVLQHRRATSTPMSTHTHAHERPTETTGTGDRHLEQIAWQQRRIQTLEEDLRVFSNGTRRRPGPLAEIAVRRRYQRGHTSVRAVPLLDFEAAVNRISPPEGELLDHKICV